MNKYLKKFVSDKNGKIVVVQSPNLPLIGWLSCVIVAALTPTVFLKTGFTNLGSAFLFLWAYLEITQGASYFRRVIGGLVLAFVVITFFI